ncbi:MAG: hypothetical protein IKQ58_01480 [Prevotella sp.]|nr:hypothetical protein [Prevotella sp.]
MKKTFRNTMIAMAALLTGTAIASCSDANEYEDFDANNPSWVNGYNDSLKIAHPETLASTKWVRGTGLKVNAYGEDIQGFVESVNFVSADSCVVKMSQGTTEGTWIDDSNTEELPFYEYTYSNVTGKLEILKLTKNDKGAITKSAIFTGVAVSGSREMLTVVHYGDVPLQTYLVKQ